MSKFALNMFSGVSLAAAMTSSAFALEDGWYHAIDVQLNCGKLSQAVLYIEGEKPLSGTIAEFSPKIQNPQKLTNMKSKMSATDGKTQIEFEISKGKSSTIKVKVTNGPECIGTRMTFSK